MGGTDVSAITTCPETPEPKRLCDDRDHVVESVGRVRVCAECGYRVQSVVDWWGHELSR